MRKWKGLKERQTDRLIIMFFFIPISLHLAKVFKDILCNVSALQMSKKRQDLLLWISLSYVFRLFCVF